MPTTTPEHDERVAKMTFSSVSPLYVSKVEKKGRTEAELNTVIRWLTGFDAKTLQEHVKDEDLAFEQFFKQAKLNPDAHLITGVICGYRVEEIEDPLTRKARQLDKLVDELARGEGDGEDPPRRVRADLRSTRCSPRGSDAGPRRASPTVASMSSSPL